jgi:hypothetical protein
VLTWRRIRVLGWFGAVVSWGAFTGCGGRSDTDFDDGWGAGNSSGGSSSGSGASSTGGSNVAATGGTTGSGAGGGRPVTGGAGPIGGSPSVAGGTSNGGTSPGGDGGFGAGASGGIAGFGAAAGFGGFGGGPGACVECIATNCPAAEECLTDVGCVRGVICGATTCLDQPPGGGPLGCWLGCFGGDPQKALKAYTALTCVVDGCGMQCASGFGL